MYGRYKMPLQAGGHEITTWLGRMDITKAKAIRYWKAAG